MDKVKSNKDVILEAQRGKSTLVHCGQLSSQECRVRTKAQKYTGRLVFRGDMVEDDSAAHAVFTEQGTSASQMTAAKEMDVVARLPGCAGQAADAVSAYTQVKIEDDPKLLKIPKSECPDIWVRLPRNKWSELPTSSSSFQLSLTSFYRTK